MEDLTIETLNKRISKIEYLLDASMKEKKTIKKVQDQQKIINLHNIKRIEILEKVNKENSQLIFDFKKTIQFFQEHMKVYERKCDDVKFSNEMINLRLDKFKPVKLLASGKLPQ